MSKLLSRTEREIRADIIRNLSDGRSWSSAPTGLMEDAAYEIKRLERALTRATKRKQTHR